MLRNAMALARIVRERALRPDPRARARAGLERLLRRDAHRRAVPHQLVQRLPRAERLQAPLQRRDGARRPRGRDQRSDRRADRRALHDAVGTDRRRFPPASISSASIPRGVSPAAHRRGARSLGRRQPTTKVILVVGRMLRRKGHHVVVQAVRRLKEIGLKDFLCVFVGEDQGKTPLHRRAVGPGARDRHRRGHPHGRARPTTCRPRSPPRPSW